MSGGCDGVNSSVLGDDPMTLARYEVDILRQDGRERFGPGTRLQITAGYGCTVIEFFRNDSDLAAIPLDRRLCCERQTASA